MSLSLNDVFENAQVRQSEYNQKLECSVEKDEYKNVSSKASKINRRQFFSVLRKILDKADIILEVLDARDPINTRCKALEKEAGKRGKKIMLILNKIDLVPQTVVKGWISYLQQFYPTIAFKSVVNNSHSSSLFSSFLSLDFQNTPNNDIQSDHIFQISHGDSIGNLAFLSSIKSSIHSDSGLRVILGVVGYPNVGKSSFINRFFFVFVVINIFYQISLTRIGSSASVERRGRVVKTSSNPGCTRVLQTIVSFLYNYSFHLFKFYYYIII
jgi:nuclear GTP-binding protein